MSLKKSKQSLNLPIIKDRTITEAEADSAISLLSQAIVPKAAELARAGKYREAEILLQHLVQEGGAIPAVYDLLARIRVQQGQLLEAQLFWAESSRLDSTQDLYRAALKRIEQLQKHPTWFRQSRRLLLGLGFIIGVMIIITTTRFHIPSLQIPTINIKTVKTVLPQPNLDIVKEKLPKITLNIPDTLVSNQVNQLIITFKSGLFLHGTELQPEAKTILDVLAEQLEPYVGQIQVNIEGHTDNIPINGLIYQDNVSLGLHRAVTVVEYLRLKRHLPAKMFTASGLGELQALYPNDSFNNQLRNRTVIIRIISLK